MVLKFSKQVLQWCRFIGTFLIKKRTYIAAEFHNINLRETKIDIPGMSKWGKLPFKCFPKTNLRISRWHYNIRPFTSIFGFGYYNGGCQIQNLHTNDQILYITTAKKKKHIRIWFFKSNFFFHLVNVKWITKLNITLQT